jgi:hypothetical protein
MSDIIRAVTANFTPMPRARSNDVRVGSPPDTYRFMQNDIESAQRQNERAVARLIRATGRASMSQSTAPRSVSVNNWPSIILTLPIR